MDAIRFDEFKAEATEVLRLCGAAATAMKEFGLKWEPACGAIATGTDADLSPEQAEEAGELIKRLLAAATPDE